MQTRPSVYAGEYFDPEEWGPCLPHMPTFGNEAPQGARRNRITTEAGRGMGHHQKLSDEDWQEVRRLRAEGTPYRELAHRFRVSHVTIRHHLMYGCANPNGRVRASRAKEDKRRYPEGEPAIARQPEVQDAFFAHDVKQLAERGYKPNDIAALLRKPYREVRAALELT